MLMRVCVCVCVLSVWCEWRGKNVNVCVCVHEKTCTLFGCMSNAGVLFIWSEEVTGKGGFRARTQVHHAQGVVEVANVAKMQTTLPRNEVRGHASSR